MLDVFVLRRDDDTSVKIGDVYSFEDVTYVVIRIVEVLLDIQNNDTVSYKVIAQCLKEDEPPQRHLPPLLHRSYCRDNLEKGLEEILKVGAITRVEVINSLNTSCVRVLAEISNIKSAANDASHIHIDYEIQAILEWPNHKIEQYIRANRKAKFRLIGKDSCGEGCMTDLN